MLIEKDESYKVYTINNRGEYGTFVFNYDSNFLEIICHTSYGVYGHTWTAPGSNPYDFLINISYESFIYKISGAKHKVVSNNRQEELMLEDLQSVAIANSWDEDEIDIYKDEISGLFYSSLMSEEEFRNIVYGSEIFEKIYDFSSDFEILTDDHPHLKHLWEELWVPLIEKIKEDEKNRGEKLNIII